MRSHRIAFAAAALLCFASLTGCSSTPELDMDEMQTEIATQAQTG
jgi:hypothetical protein